MLEDAQYVCSCDRGVYFCRAGNKHSPQRDALEIGAIRTVGIRGRLNNRIASVKAIIPSSVRFSLAKVQWQRTQNFKASKIYVMRAALVLKWKRSRVRLPASTVQEVQGAYCGFVGCFGCGYPCPRFSKRRFMHGSEPASPPYRALEFLSGQTHILADVQKRRKRSSIRKRGRLQKFQTWRLRGALVESLHRICISVSV